MCSVDRCSSSCVVLCDRNVVIDVGIYKMELSIRVEAG